MSVYNRTIDDGPFGPGHVTLMYRPLLLSSPWLAPHPRPHSQTIFTMLIIPGASRQPDQQRRDTLSRRHFELQFSAVGGVPLWYCHGLDSLVNFRSETLLILRTVTQNLE